jgi:hypothetical protein
LFSSIFLFVDTFPRPPAQPSSQFSANLVYGGVGGGHIVGVDVLHLAGPTLTGSNVVIYLYSSDHPSRFTGPFTIAQGLNGTTSWNLGQTWAVNVTSDSLTTPDQITISIVSTTQLLFRVTLPGSIPNLPPQFVAQGTTPTNPVVFSGFSIYAQIVDSTLKPQSVYANVSQIPGSGLPAKDLMSYSSTTGLYTLSVPNGASVAGTYYVFVNATDNLSQTNTIAIPVIIGIGSVPNSGVAVAVSPFPVVNRTAETIFATVQNSAGSAGTVSLTFKAGATVLGTTSGPISAGGYAEFTNAWTPTAVGTVTLSVLANVSVGGAPTGALNVTVFPAVLFISHNVVAGTRLVNNTSAYLAEELQAAGFPFTPMFVACNAALPAATSLEAYDVVVIDWGSTATGTCATTPSTTEQGKITTAMAASSFTSFLMVGSSEFTATSCASYAAAFRSDFGMTGSSGTCIGTSSSATTAATYSAVSAQGFRRDGIGALTINKTLAASSGFLPYAYFSQGGSNTFLSTASGAVGIFTHVAKTGRGVMIGTDPALLMTTLPAPASAAWGQGAGGSAVLYNAMNYLSKFSTSGSTGRTFGDYAISGATLTGLSAGHLSFIYVTIRSNGPVGGLVEVSLTTNGTQALYGGAPVSTTVALLTTGQNVTAILTWEAPVSGSYSLAVTATSFQSNLFGTLTQLPLNVLNKPTVYVP